MAAFNHTTAVPFLGFGNGLAADKDVRVGEVIIDIAEPFLILVESIMLDHACSQCLNKIEEGLKRCSGCKVVQYCSVECQQKAWKSIHKQECRIFKTLPQTLPTAMRGLVQLLLRKEVTGGVSDTRWIQLEDHEQALKKGDEWNGILLQAKAALEMTSSSPDSLGPALKVLCRVSLEAPF